jgi:poly-gamma-glutamate synthesis protein (capsule biosynthesis protein)
VSLARECGQEILKNPEYDPLAALSRWFGPSDLAFVNLESQLSEQGGVTQHPLNRLVFTGPPGGAEVLARAGIDVVSLANNHAWDYGRAAFLETLERLTAAKVRFAGASAEPDAAYRPVTLRIRGWSVALFAVTHIWNYGEFHEHAGRAHVAWADAARLLPAIVAARTQHDVVLVSYHGGSEYVDVPMRFTKVLARAVMKAGADAFIGHHPHVPHGIAFMQERPVFYSLGNLVFGAHVERPWTGVGFVAKLVFSRDGPPRVAACPYSISGYTPSPLAAGDTGGELRFRRHIERLSVGLGGARLGERDAEGCLAVLPPGPDLDAPQPN